MTQVREWASSGLEVLNKAFQLKAFQLAYFIIGDREAAKKIAFAALARLQVAVAAQDKRLYYLPTGRGRSLGKARTKVSLSESQLIQRLVYLESERHELRQEESFPPSVLSEDDMMIRFIKHLVKITLHRNSFYVTVGLSRLLYSYTTNETIQIYTFLTQAPDQSPDDDYYRHRKKDLLKDLKERFNGLLITHKGLHGEERFEPHPDQRRFLKLTNECLRKFTPWETDCVLPVKFDPETQEIPALSHRDPDPDAGHRAEINRIHTLIDPVCFEKMVMALNLCSPEESLALPKFLLSENVDPNSPRERRPPTDLSADELNTLEDDLGKQGMRRKKATTGVLKICVDGQERTQIDPRESCRASIQIAEDDEVIEVWGDDQAGPLLLAALVLSGADLTGDERKAAIILEGDQRITFTIRSQPDANGRSNQMLLEVLYRQDGWLGWFKLWRDHLADRLADLKDAVTRNKSQVIPAEINHRQSRFKSPMLAFLTLALGLVVTFFLVFEFILKKRSEPTDEALNQARPAQSLAPEPTRPASSSSPGESSKVAPPQTRDDRSASPVFRAREGMRGAAGNSLELVKAIYIQIEGVGQENASMRSAVIKAILNGGRFDVVNNELEADASLRIEIESITPDGELRTVAKLVQGRQVLWPLKDSLKGKAYQGRIDDISSEIIRDLTSDGAKRQSQ